MRVIQNKIFLEWEAAIMVGIPKGTLDSAKNRNSLDWCFISDPNDSRKVLIEYSSLKDRYKALIIKNLCNGLEPFQFLSTALLKQLLKSKKEDKEYILQYRTPSGQFLPENKTSGYIKAAEILHTLDKLTIKEIKSIGFRTTADFYTRLFELIKAENIPLQSSYSRLKMAVREYRKHGADSVIEKYFGLKRNVKVEEEQETYLRTLFGKHYQLNAAQVAKIYNTHAAAQSWKTITSTTVYNHLQKHELLGAREGISSYRNANDYIIKRMRPSAPNMLWVGDATPYELYYQIAERDSKGHLQRNYYKRKVVYVVIDAFNDCIMGYSVGETECNELARLAWKNACITQGVLPEQVKTDNYGKKELTPFYSKIALNSDFYTPSAIGNARDKVIEPFFGRIYNFVTKFHENASGRNITSKQQPNRDYLEKIKHSFPDEAGVMKQIEHDMTYWNHAERENLYGKSIYQQYQEGDHTEDRKLDDLKRLYIFGTKHNYTNALTNRGIVVTLKGEERSYMNFDDVKFYETLGTSYQVIYDENDFTKILVTAKEGTIRFMLDEFLPFPMAFGDMKEGDRARLNKVLDFKKRNIEKHIKQREDDIEAVNRMGIDVSSESILKSLASIKGDQKQLHYQAQNKIKEISEPVKLKVLKAVKERKEDTTKECFENIYQNQRREIKPVE